MGPKQTSDPNTPTKTNWIFEQLRFVDTRARSLYAEQIRALIRLGGLTGVKDSNSLSLQYYILFVDETTTKHFAQFQGMWTHRNDREGEYHEWWGAFRAFLRDCFDKTRAQLNAVAAQAPATIGDEDGDELPPMCPCTPSGGTGGDGGEGRAGRGGRGKGVEKGAGKEEPTRWFPLQPSLVLPPAGKGKGRVEFLGRQPGESGGDSRACLFRAVIIDPDCADNSSRSGVHDDYDVFGTDVRKHLTNIPALSIRALFDTVKRFCAKREPRAMYGCLLEPRQYSAARDETAPAEVEQMARMSGGTYKLSPQDTTQLWSDNSVRAFFSLSTYTPLWVLVILRRDAASGRGDTPPREAQTTFDAVGRVTRATRLPNGGVQTKPNLLASINVIGCQKAQLDCRSRRLKLLADELGFRDFCYPHEADYVPGISEDDHQAQKRQRSLSSDPISEGGEGSDDHSQRKRPRPGSGARVGEHPSVKDGDSSASGTGGHIESANSGDETAPPRATEVPSREPSPDTRTQPDMYRGHHPAVSGNPSTPRRRILIPSMSWFTSLARRAAMVDEAEDGGFRTGEAGSGKGQPDGGCGIGFHEE
jgi:hypothetical protein